MRPIRLIVLAACVMLALIAVATASTTPSITMSIPSVTSAGPIDPVSTSLAPFTAATFTVTGISPNQGAKGTRVRAAITGTGLTYGVRVFLHHQAVPGVSYTDVDGLLKTLESDSKLSFYFDIPYEQYQGHSETAGYWDVYVVDPSTGRDVTTVFSNAFLIVEPSPPTITSGPLGYYNQPTGSAGGNTLYVTRHLTGTGFGAATTVTLRRAGEPDIVGYNIDVYSQSSLHYMLAIPPGTAMGMYDLVVTNPGWTVVNYPELAYVPPMSATLSNALEIIQPLAITGIHPATGSPSAVVKAGIDGTGFRPNARVALRHTGLADINATNVQVDPLDMTRLTCEFAIPATGALYVWDVVLTNDNGQSATVERCFTVSAQPTVPPVRFPGCSIAPTDTDGDGKFDDVNGNGRPDFADVVLYFNQMNWITANEPVAAFDYNGNGRIDFADVVQLFNHL